jgi:hypothetical protein
VGTVQILPYWTCPGCHVGRVVHLATGILVLQVLLVIAVTSLFYIVYRLIVVYIVVVDYLVSKCDSEAARGKLNINCSQSQDRFHFLRLVEKTVASMPMAFVIIFVGIPSRVVLKLTCITTRITRTVL